MDHQEPGSGALDDSNGVDLESMGIVPLSLIHDQHLLSMDARDERLALSTTPSPDLLKADNERMEDNSLNGIIIINGEKFHQIGQGLTDALSHVATNMDIAAVPTAQFVGQPNNMELTCAGNLLQIVRTNNQSVEPPDGKVPISRINTKSTVSDSIIVSPTVPTSQSFVLSKPLSLDFSTTNLLASQGIIGQNLLLQLQQSEESVSNGANLPLKLVIPNEVEQPEANIKRECLWMGCGKVFEQLDALVNHVNDQHVKVSEREVEYICKWKNCPRRGKGFNARYKMLIHVRTHTKEKPHNCPLCGKSFSRLENLKIHSRSHTGEKPYVCPFEGCNKAYSNSSDRFKHVRTHQVDRPYLCKMPGCGKRYTDPSSLRKHVKTHGHSCHCINSQEMSIGDAAVNDYTVLELNQSDVNFMQSKDVIGAGDHEGDSGKNSNGEASPGLYPVPITSTSLHLPAATQISSVQGHVVDIPDLTSNPLLTSTVDIYLTNAACSHNDDTKTDLSDLPLKDLNSDSVVGVLDGEKGQETPLDLSTSPIASMEMIHSNGIE